MSQYWETIKPIIAIVILSLLATPLKADSRVNNGGYGVFVGQHLYSLDLVLRNRHENPYLGYRLLESRFKPIYVQIQTNLSPIESKSVRDLVAKKIVSLAAGLEDIRREIAEIVGDKASVSGLFKFDLKRLLGASNSIQWVNLQHVNCRMVDDFPQVYFDLVQNRDYNLGQVVQLAYRRSNHVFLCASYYRLDEANQAALLLHEIIYAAYPRGREQIMQLVGFLFSPGMELLWSHDKEELAAILTSLNQY